MKIRLIFLLFLGFMGKGFAQTVVWQDDFTSGTGWTLNDLGTTYIPSSTPSSNGSDPNSWVINSDFGTYPSSSNGGNYLHITCTSFICSFLGAPGPVFNASNASNNTNRTAVLTTDIPGATLTGAGPFTLRFEWLCEAGTGPHGAKLIYSINGGAWQEYSVDYKLQSAAWQNEAIDLATLGHNSGDSFRFGFRWYNSGSANASDPPMMVDNVRITVPSVSNTITTNPLGITVFCPGDIFNVSFTSTGTFNAGNVYRVELSDATGSFASPTVIGTLNSTANAGTINCTMPIATPPGTNYRIRVVASNPATIGTDSGQDLTVNPTLNPTVTISANPGSSICPGENVTFTANVTGLGSVSPDYQWQLNTGSGFTNVGTNSSTYSNSGLNNGDQIRVQVAYIGPCDNGVITSNVITMTVSATASPSVSISASPGTSICSGQSVTFTATPTNGGSSPSYQWQLNTGSGFNNVGTNSATYTNNSLADGDQVRVIMTSNASCVFPTTATSNVLTMTVTPAVTPSVSISANPGTSICSGQSVTFTATPTNGGSSPSYQWQLNTGSGFNNVGTNSATYTNSSLADGDQVRVILTSSDACASPSSATSNVLTITVGTNVTLTPNVVVSPGTTVCAGQTVTFTELNNYANTSYQWNVNGNPVTGATTNVFTTSTLANGDQVSVTLTPLGCGSSATSNAITITVNSAPSTSVSITSNPSSTTICAGTSVTFTATPVNGGTSPSYSWAINGNPVGTNSPTFTTSTLANGDQVSVTMSSSLPCSSPATSNTITYTVNNPLPVSATITANPSNTTICAGTSITFTATPVNGGANPQYQWQLNGSNIPGATSSTYTTTSLSNNDVINVVVTSSETCVSGNPASSNSIQYTVLTPLTPSVTISANPSTAVCAGTSITFTATPANVTLPPNYQWYVNGTPVSGATNSTFVTSTLSDGDIVTVELTSNDDCVTSSTVTSNAITAQITSPLPVSVSIEANDTSVCAGTSVTFTATVNNGGTASYQWTVNGVNSGTNSPIFSYVPNGGDVVTVIATSSLTCVSGNPASASPITMVVSPNPTVSCSANDGIVGTNIPFTATVNSGTAPFTITYDFGDGNQTTSSNTTENHVYTLTGSFNYTISVVDANGCTATCGGSVTISNLPQPIASFETGDGLYAGCAPFVVSFVNNSANAQTTSWDFGDGNTSNLPNPTNVYTNSGVYTVTLIVNNSFGADTAVALIVVHPSPTAGIQVLTTNPNIFEPTEFQDQSIGAAEWEWNFGDPNSSANTSTVQNPSHQFSASGTYTVTLIVTNAFGCKDTVTSDISISSVSNDKPQELAGLSVYPNPFQEKFVVKFYSNSTENVRFSLFDQLGRIVFEKEQFNVSLGENSFELQTSDIVNGVYHLEIVQGNFASTVKLVNIK